MRWLLTPPSSEDFARLLKAWRFWVLGSLVGALIGTAAYYLFPPAYRGQATVVVDFNLEQAWPQETDRQLFYYLERETRKLVEVAWSDATMEIVATKVGDVPVGEFRSGKLLLSQPGEGGWHFWADDDDPARAVKLAATWAEAFGEQVQRGVSVAVQLADLYTLMQTQTNFQPDNTLEAKIQELEGKSLGISPYIQVNVSQTIDIPVYRKIGMGTYILVGGMITLVLGAFWILFTGSKEIPHAAK
jgi:hypothetical protein